MRAPRFQHSPMVHATRDELCAEIDEMDREYAVRNPEKAAILERWKRKEISGVEADRLLREVDAGKSSQS